MRERELLKRDIDKLKKSVRQERDIAAVMSAFFDLCETTDLTRRSSPAKNEKLEAILPHLLGMVVGKDEKVMAALEPVVVAEHGLFHGVLICGDHMGTYFYFQDLDCGVCMISLPRGVTHSLRFSVLDAPPVPAAVGAPS